MLKCSNRITMDDQCRTQPPTPPNVCSKNCNKCMASTTSRMLYYTLVKRLNERDEKNKKPIAVAAPHHYDDPEKPKLKPIPDPIPNPKRRKPIEPPTLLDHSGIIQPTSLGARFGTCSIPPSSSIPVKKYYCYSKMQINNKKCCSECRLVIQETIDGTWSLP